ncbi:hypothetical protein [Actinoplanes couchii]|uniref:SseB protein N-terminal domain-containing protein n=1 Tax=Actinoplanes couchii TaxID=403638 RepID=A0ABQ3X3T9_9ACTN|nr:hypothetical protein [Actinoplanes couchii]MDR6322930.1 hypothetical protein [Actinoplanes couchii]GID53170.1 hypothetical protein Aco03nite_015740 [Actinoplanes couchii]
MNRPDRTPVRPPAQGTQQRSGAWTVDHAVRALATACAEWQRPVPQVGALVLGPDSVMLRLSCPDEAPPAGWIAEQAGRTWTMPLRELHSAPVSDHVTDALPMLVSIGAGDEGRVMLNLAEANGMISLTGDDALARGMVRSWSRRLTTGPWAANARVIRVGFEPDQDFTGWDVSRLVEAAQVLDAPEGGIVLFAAPPQGRDLYLVDRLLEEPVRRWTVVSVHGENATWRFTVSTDGKVDTGLFKEPLLLRS